MTVYNQVIERDREPSEGVTDMTVDYYEIKGCAFDMYCGRPAIFAPVGTAADIMANYGFSLMNDGRYVHFLDQQEYYHVMMQSGCERVVFDYSTWVNISSFYSARRYELGLPVANYQDRSAGTTPNMLCGISLGLFCFSVVSVFFIPYFSLAAFIAAIVLMIIVRASYPKNTFGLVLMILYIAVVAISFIAGILLLAACYQMLKECNIPC